MEHIKRLVIRWRNVILGGSLASAGFFEFFDGNVLTGVSLMVGGGSCLLYYIDKNKEELGRLVDEKLDEVRAYL